MVKSAGDEAQQEVGKKVEAKEAAVKPAAMSRRISDSGSARAPPAVPELIAQTVRDSFKRLATQIKIKTGEPQTLPPWAKVDLERDMASEAGSDAKYIS